MFPKGRAGAMHVAHGGAFGDVESARDIAIGHVEEGAEQKAGAGGFIERAKGVKDLIVKGVVAAEKLSAAVDQGVGERLGGGGNGGEGLGIAGL